MADNKLVAFTTLDSAKEAHKALLATDPSSKKKVYCVTLPSVEQYAAFLKVQGTQSFYAPADGYAAHAYTLIRLMGGEVSAASDKADKTAALAAANAAKEAAERAAKEAKDALEVLQKQIDDMRAAQAAANGVPVATPAEPAKRGKGKTE